MKIVIAGGGTAGWLSALFLAKQNLHRDEPAYDVTVIESEDIPIIGAGEGSTGVLQKILLSTLTELEGFNEQEFFHNCNTTFKLGIDCIDWNGVGDRFFESLQQSQTSDWPLDRDFTICTKYGVSGDSVLNKYLWERGLSPFLKDENNKAAYQTGYAYHFDAHKVGEWFKKIALENGIKLQTGTITDTNLNPKNGELQKVILKDGTEIESDFWIDCTGFNRVLSNAVGAEWISYSEYLPINSALVYTHKYEEGEQIPNVTTAWAMPNGWMWQIPTQERLGCGYCYSDKFVSEEQALKEMQEITGRKIEPLRNIKFDSGRLKEVWKKNVLSIGLSSSFLEPLEATSIHSSIIQLVQLTQHHLSPYKEDMMRESNIKANNEHFNMMLDEFRALIQIHYITKRNDTPFWKYVHNDLKRDPLVEKILEICQWRVPNAYDFPHFNGSASWGVWCWILAGNGLISEEVLNKSLHTHAFYDESEKVYKHMVKQYGFDTRNYFPHTKFINWVREYVHNGGKDFEIKK